MLDCFARITYSCKNQMLNFVTIHLHGVLHLPNEIHVEHVLEQTNAMCKQYLEYCDTCIFTNDLTFPFHNSRPTSFWKEFSLLLRCCRRIDAAARTLGWACKGFLGLVQAVRTATRPGIFCLRSLQLSWMLVCILPRVWLVWL